MTGCTSRIDRQIWVKDHTSHFLPKTLEEEGVTRKGCTFQGFDDLIKTLEKESTQNI